MVNKDEYINNYIFPWELEPGSTPTKSVPIPLSITMAYLGVKYLMSLSLTLYVDIVTARVYVLVLSK